jgi:hypothetical protein
VQEWTINNVSLADLGIDSLQLHLQNQDDDYVDIRFPRNYDSALPDGFDVDAPLVVRCGSTVVFRGEVATPLQSASAFAEYRSVFAYGPWHRFREMPFLYMYPYVTGAALSTHGVLGGNASDLLNAILTTNADGIVQVGTIDVGSLAIPETEVYDQTLAQALQAVLRYIVGAVVAFDYSTAPPTVHIVADNSTALTSVPIDVNDGLNSAFNLSPLYARLISGVTIQYEATGQVQTGVLEFKQSYDVAVTDDTIDTPSQWSGFFILGSDSAGDAASRRHFRRTIRLEGAYDISSYVWHGQVWPYWPLEQAPNSSGKQFTLDTLLGVTTQSGYTAKNLRIYIDRACYFTKFWSWASNANMAFNFGGHTGAQQANVGGFTNFDSALPGGTGLEWLSAGGGDVYSSLKYLRPLMRTGLPYTSRSQPITLTGHPYIIKHSWGPSSPVNNLDHFFQTEELPGARVAAFGCRWDSSGGTIRNWTPDGTVYRIPFVDDRTVGAINSSTGRFDHVKTVDNSSAVLPEAGIAAQLLAANNRLLYEGRLTRLLDDPSDFAGLNRKVLFTNLAVSALVQRLSYDTATNLADLTFGAPTHLGPQDLIALQRAGKSPA